MTPLISPLSEEEIAAILARPKFWAGDLAWAERPNNSNLLLATTPLLDDTGATIPGLTAELRFRRGVVSDRCKYQFSIFSFRGNRERVYQIEIVPPDQKCHRQDGVPWYGPHQHFGHRAAKMPEGVTVGCTDHEECFRVFLKLANIQFSGKYLPPLLQIELDL